MGTQLFPSLANRFKEDYASSIFWPFQGGFILPVNDIKRGDTYSFGKVFIDTMARGQFIVNDSGTVIAYYFRSSFKLVNHSAFIICYLQAKAGLAKECKRVYADDSLVILDFTGCGMAIISPQANDKIASILEEQ